jgi:hypothetical protein
MATELEHIELANRNHEALRALLGAADDHPEWVATIAFYKALQILEATFASKGLGHSHGHSKRLEIIQDARNGYASLCRHYEALLEASEVARYLGARNTGGSGYSKFSDYMSMHEVRENLIKKRLMNVEMHARQFLSEDAKRLLKQCRDLLGANL